MTDIDSRWRVRAEIARAATRAGNAASHAQSALADVRAGTWIYDDSFYDIDTAILESRKTIEASRQTIDALEKLAAVQLGRRDQGDKAA